MFPRILFRLIRNNWEVYTLQFVTLSVAILTAIVIISYGYSELTVSHDLGDGRTVRILERNKSDLFIGKNRWSDRIPPRVLDLLAKDPNTHSIVRVKTLENISVTGDHTMHRIRVHAADSNVFDILHLDVTGGGADFERLPGAALSRALAAQLFDGDAVGKKIQLHTSGGSAVEMVIVDVFETSSQNAHDRFELIMRFDPAHLTLLGFNPGSFGVYATLATLPENGELNVPLFADTTYYAQPLADIYLGPRVRGESARHGDTYCIAILMCTAFLIVLLAVTNYLNLTTLTLPERATELAVRKVAGSGNFHLLRMMTVESSCIVLISFAVACVMLFASAQPAKVYLDIDMMAWVLGGSWATCLLIAGMLALMAILAVVPAWAFAKATPSRLLSPEAIGFPTLKKAITVFQLGVSFSLIVASLVVNRQIARSLIKEPGTNHEQIVYMNYPSGFPLDAFHDLQTSWPRNNPNIVGVTSTSHLIDQLRSRPLDGGCVQLGVDYNFMNFMELSLESGRWFGPGDGDSVVVNSRARHLASTAIGSYDNLLDQFNLPEPPMQLTIAKGEPRFIMVRVLEVDIRKTLGFIERFFMKNGHGPAVTFLDRNYQQMLTTEDRLDRLSGLLSLISLVMACCSIYAISLSRITDQLKQIAIRKTFGATNEQIVGRISLGFLEIMLVSIVFFGPLAHFALEGWLSGFVYATRLEWFDPLISIGVCLMLVAITNLLLLRRVSTESIRTLLRR